MVLKRVFTCWVNKKQIFFFLVSIFLSCATSKKFSGREEKNRLGTVETDTVETPTPAFFTAREKMSKSSHRISTAQVFGALADLWGVHFKTLSLSLSEEISNYSSHQQRVSLT